MEDLTLDNVEYVRAFVERRVHDDYWTKDLNCATTTLRILSEQFETPVHCQVLDAARGDGALELVGRRRADVPGPVWPCAWPAR